MSKEYKAGTSSEAIDVSAADWTASGKVRAVYVGGTGTIVGRLSGDSADSTWTDVPAGDFLREFSVIRTSGTTATGLVAVY